MVDVWGAALSRVDEAPLYITLIPAATKKAQFINKIWR